MGIKLLAEEIVVVSAPKSCGEGVVIGEAYLGFEDRIVPKTAERKLREDSIAILSRCATKSGADPVTGLVVGQVQSGKTMSYEGVICLAHDSGFPLVIVVSGISTPLQDQGVKRLREDLTKASERDWHFLENPKKGDTSSLSLLESVVRDWSDPDVPHSRRRTVVISVLKHHGHLKHLNELLGSVSWDGWPVLIIDDEADQASLNTRANRKGASSTYAVLLQLRLLFRTFSYIQYTATPQAPLLISIADTLSPEFVHVLDPGEGYVGGEVLFKDSTSHVQSIPSGDVTAITSSTVDPPKSLVQALRVFFLGLAYELEDPNFHGCRSMLIHPSQITDPHARYSTWAKNLLEKWLDIVNLRAEYPEDFEDLIEEFEEARSDLLKTCSELPEVRAITSSLKFALRRTHVITMNANLGKTPTVPWEDFDGFILVGGQALDRGFTVQGLTVTYMSRGTGVGNADTIQQRARFFGYKAGYLQYCRVYLESDLLAAFQNYVEHEIDIRARLKSRQESGAPLSDWRRAFVLDPSLKPTRQTVQRAGYLQDQLADEWYWDNRAGLDTLTVERTRVAVERFRDNTTFVHLEGHPSRTKSQRHQVAVGISLKDVVELLAALPVVDERNSLMATGLLVQLEHVLEQNPSEECNVYSMRSSDRTVRGLRAHDTISQLFQGESPATKTTPRGEVYPGDRSIRGDDRVSVQLHSIDIEQEGSLIAADVPVVAVWVPARLATGWFVQQK